MRTDDIVLPIVHANGTSLQSLIEQRADAIDALHRAGTALAQMGPNGRDYYPLPRLMDRAVAQHDRRLKALKELIDEITHEMMILDDHGQPEFTAEERDAAARTQGAAP